MKIEKLIIQNLNSIEDAEIVFSEGILAQEPLFLICGETGSGKTTILDAITLALYDRVSRYENVKNKEMTESGVRTNDALNILRKGKYDGKAELHFCVKDTHYIATWSIHKTRTNKYSNTNRRKLEVVDGELRTVLLDKVVTVNKMIEELVGLTYEQFVRSVMLAQGEFNAFLVSDKTAQSEILEMLTGTEVYSDIANAVKVKKNEALAKRKEAETLCNSLKDKVLSQEEIDGLKARHEELTMNISQKESSKKLLENSLAWLKRNAELHKECSDAKLLLDNVLERINSNEYKENQAVVEDYFKTEREREALREQLRLESELLKLGENYDNDVRVFLNLKESLQNERVNKEKLSHGLEKLKEWIANHKDDEVVFDNFTLILGVLKEMDEMSKSLESNENELKCNMAKRETLVVQLQTLSRFFDAIKKSKQEAECDIENLLNNFKSEEYQSLLDEQQKLDRERKSYVDRNFKLNSIRAVLAQYLDSCESIKNEKDKHTDLNLSLNQKNEELLHAKLAFERKDSEYQDQKEMVEDWAKEVRMKLKDGDPCPVCGSTEHRFKDEVLVQSLFSVIKRDWENLRAEYEKAKDIVNKIEAELKTTSDNINKVEARSASLLNNLNVLCDGKVVFEIERIDEAIKKYDALILNIDRQILDINEKLNNIALVKVKIDEAQKNKKFIDDKYNSAEKEFEGKRVEYQQLELALNTISTIIKEQKLKLSDNETLLDKYIKIENWKQYFLDSPACFIKQVENVAQEWKSKNESIKDIERQISSICDVIETCEGFVSNIQPLVANCNLEFMSKVINTQDLVPSFSAVYEKIKERISEKSIRQEKMKILRSSIGDFIDNNADITFERLKYLEGISDIQYFAQKNKALDNECIKAKNTLAIKMEMLESHQNVDTKPEEGMSLDELELRLLSLVDEKKMDEEALSEVNMRLAVNAQNTSSSVEYQKNLEEKDRIYNLWEQLAKAIGTTEGDNFRDVAQSYTMGILLDRANYYMCQLSSRYRLKNYSDSLAIMVQDMEMGGELRAASSLSGGETFLVSLALALGLTSLNDNHFNADMLFIDEGFGTLDSDSLDMVMNTLENLHNIGRRVGIISHVDTLKERIPAQIQLVREGKSASKVKVVRN